MFSLWQNRALERFHALQIDKDKLLGSHDIVCAAVGTDWLNQQQKKLDLPHHNISDAHPLFRSLKSPADVNLIIVCELAEYLRAFLQDAAISPILLDLKSSKFEATFFELAIAYRWLKAGGAVNLHPPTPKGEADFEATIDGKKFIAEVSIFPADIFSQQLFRLPSVAKKTIESTIKKQIPVAIKIRIKEFPPGDIEGLLHHSVKNACNALISQVYKGVSQPILQDAGFCTIEIETITTTTEQTPNEPDPSALNGQEWNVVIKGTERHTPEEGEPLYRVIGQEDERELFRLFMKFPPLEENPFEKVLKKLVKESRQLHGIRSSRVVILDVSAVDPGFLSAYLQPSRNGISKLMHDTPELAAIWLLNRGWTTEFRYQYRGLYISNDIDMYSVPSSFMEKLIELEQRWDFLEGREFPYKSQEEAIQDHEQRR